MYRLFLTVLFVPLFCFGDIATANNGPETNFGHIAVLEMDMIILPGTQGYLEKGIEEATAAGAKAIVVKLDTPGGMLDTTQQMIQEIFKSTIPIIIYVTPTGATATSAGVFITVAGHLAVMAPGTSIGAAHPVTGEGKDIEGDMRKKAENMTVAMVKSIGAERGRNVEWVEKAVTDSDSITEQEALKNNVIDLIAANVHDLLSQAEGKKFKLLDKDFVMPDYSALPVKVYAIGVKDKVMNVVAHPNIAALLWLGATTGLSLELYNPGAILPGVVGVICLVLALTVMQIIPITQTGMILLIVGAFMLVAEMFIPSGILAIGGIVSLVLGSIYLVDTVQAPGLAVDLEVIIPIMLAVSGFFFWVLSVVRKAHTSGATTGKQGLIGQIASAERNFGENSKVFVNGEIWNANLTEGDATKIKKGDKLEVLGVENNLTLTVKLIEKE